MQDRLKNILQVELGQPEQREQLLHLARQRNWGMSLILIGWLHLLAFLFCYYLTIVKDYHEAAGYLLTWTAELLGMWLIFRLCGGRRHPNMTGNPLELFIRRVWIAYFLLAFNLGSMNTLRGHKMFELFPAMASLASFAFIMMSVVIHWRFILAMLVMFASGLLMAAYWYHAYLIFAVAWWLVLNAIGWELLVPYRRERRSGRSVRIRHIEEVVGR